LSVIFSVHHFYLYCLVVIATKTSFPLVILLNLRLIYILMRFVHLAL